MEETVSESATLNWIGNLLTNLLILSSANVYLFRHHVIDAVRELCNYINDGKGKLTHFNNLLFGVYVCFGITESLTVDTSILESAQFRNRIWNIFSIFNSILEFIIFGVLFLIILLYCGVLSLFGYLSIEGS